MCWEFLMVWCCSGRGRVNHQLFWHSQSVLCIKHNSMKHFEVSSRWQELVMVCQNQTLERSILLSVGRWPARSHWCFLPSHHWEVSWICFSPESRHVGCDVTDGNWCPPSPSPASSRLFQMPLKVPVLLLAVVCSWSVEECVCFPNGSVTFSCGNMMPVHPPFVPSTSSPPFTLSASSAAYRPGGVISGKCAAPFPSALVVPSRVAHQVRVQRSCLEALTLILALTSLTSPASDILNVLPSPHTKPVSSQWQWRCWRTAPQSSRVSCCRPGAGREMVRVTVILLVTHAVALVTWVWMLLQVSTFVPPKEWLTVFGFHCTILKDNSQCEFCGVEVLKG